jgi:MGT family glycosyltransferase
MSTTTRRFLMTTWDGGGNIPPELGVAQRLVERGHHVHVVADPTIDESARQAGCTFSPWRRAPHRSTLDPTEDVMKDWETKNPLVLLQRLRDRLLAGPAAEFADDTADAIAVFEPDCVVPDSFMFGSMIAAEAAGLPVAALVPNIWLLPSKGAPSFGPGFPPARTAVGRTRDAAVLGVINRVCRKGLPALNASRAQRGLRPLTSLYDQVLHADRILVLSSETFDYASASTPGNARYVGPVLDDPSWTRPWQAPRDSRREPLVLVGLSSTYQNQAALLRRIVRALSSLPLHGVVTLGRMLDPTVVASTPNVDVVTSASHRAILSEASVVVSHCGHGTTMRALAAGVPMVCIPMGRDQNDTAARVVHLGAGVRLSPSASTNAIRGAVHEVLGDEKYRTNASHLAGLIAAEHQGDEVAVELEFVAATPNRSRPEGATGGRSGQRGRGSND